MAAAAQALQGWSGMRGCWAWHEGLLEGAEGNGLLSQDR